MTAIFGSAVVITRSKFQAHSHAVAQAANGGETWIGRVAFEARVAFRTANQQRPLLAQAV